MLDPGQGSRLLFPVSSATGYTHPNPRLRGDPRVVPADPRETTGPQHHGLGLQQHCGDAGRVLPRLQDRVLRPRPLLHYSLPWCRCVF